MLEDVILLDRILVLAFLRGTVLLRDRAFWIDKDPILTEFLADLDGLLDGILVVRPLCVSVSH